jgi:hypothetical protein
MLIKIDSAILKDKTCEMNMGISKARVEWVLNRVDKDSWAKENGYGQRVQLI